jgi:DNA-binding response OmpR family regulator
LVKLKILLIEDEVKIAEFVTQGLRSAGHEVTHAQDGEHGLDLILAATHDVAILDLMLPKLDGFQVLQQAKAAASDMPIIILSAKIDLPDRLKGFDLGADDYLPKPFFVEELLARIKLVAKRTVPDEVQEITVGHLSLDVVTRHAKWFDVTALLSQREFSLLAYLMRSPGHIYSRQQILKHVWDINFDPETNLVDVCVRRIKLKLDRNNSPYPAPIESVRGVGYRLRVEV